uniref:Putative secreted protein n=1 Tax=Amblyomma americanum TaxID=6943 RepID=A0A0C9SCV7_AMBAM
MSAFAIIAFLTLGVTACAGHPKFTDLLEALNTTEKLHLVQRSYVKEPTYDQEQQCAYVERKSLTRKLYNFTKHFTADNTPIEIKKLHPEVLGTVHQVRYIHI